MRGQRHLKGLAEDVEIDVAVELLQPAAQVAEEVIRFLVPLTGYYCVARH
jgi:hypothetical protein